MPRNAALGQFVAEDPTARFWRKVDRSEGGCWIWTAFCHPSGYGCFWDGERSVRAHRAAWVLTRGPIPPGLVVMHTCDNPPCVNPSHLRLGTHADNVADRCQKGRSAHPRGEANHSKLSETEVTWIRTAGVLSHSQRELARQFGVNPSTISRIVGGKRWGWTASA